MMNMRALAVSALCLASLPLASAAQAATAFIDGNIFWGAGTPTTDFSETNSIANFSFDVNTPTLNPTPVSNFTYTLNNSPVTDPLSYVHFYSNAEGGLFDLVFASHTVSISGLDIGSTGTIGPSGYYQANAGLDGVIPGTGTGGVVLAVSTVPLPAALPLLATALGGLGLMARRRKIKAAA